MSFKDDFNKALNAKSASKSYRDPATLEVRCAGSTHYYDFTLRLMVRSNSNGQVVIPFSQIDPEVLEHLRDHLVQLGGNPPPLAKQKDTGMNKPMLPRKNGGQS